MSYLSLSVLSFCDSYTVKPLLILVYYPSRFSAHFQSTATKTASNFANSSKSKLLFETIFIFRFFLEHVFFFIRSLLSVSGQALYYFQFFTCMKTSSVKSSTVTVFTFTCFFISGSCRFYNFIVGWVSILIGVSGSRNHLLI